VHDVQKQWPQRSSTAVVADDVLSSFTSAPPLKNGSVDPEMEVRQMAHSSVAPEKAETERLLIESASKSTRGTAFFFGINCFPILKKNSVSRTVRSQGFEAVVSRVICRCKWRNLGDGPDVRFVKSI